MNAIRPGLNKPLPTWTVIGHLDATSADLEHHELDRIDQLERVDKRNTNVVLEVRRKHHSPLATKMGAIGTACLSPGALALGAIGGVIAGLSGGLGLGLLVAGTGALEAAITYPLTKKGFETARTSTFKSAEPDWKGTRTYAIGNDSRPGIQSPILSETKNTHAPTGEQLGTSVASKMRAYPAQRYAFILGGHGRAMSSIGDMPIPEVAKTTEIAHRSTGRKLDVMVLDSCLVGNFETLLPMADHVRYAIVSQEPVYTNVIDWGGIIHDVQDEPASANAFAKAALDRAEQKHWHQTLTTVRMSQMPALREALEHLGETLAQSARDGHRKEIKEAFKYATPVQDSDWLSRKMEQKVDLGNLIMHLRHGVSDPAVKDASDLAWTAYQKAVVDHRKSDKFFTTTGLSIQGPRLLNAGYARKSGLDGWSKALGEMKPWPLRMIDHAVGGVKRLFA